jgi:hypothetical protein
MTGRLGGVPVKTRVPLLGWVLAGLVTLFSMASSLLPNVPDAGDVATSVSEQAPTVRHASAIW